jgi:hypothetical protein
MSCLARLSPSRRLPTGSQFYVLDDTPVALVPLPEGRIKARAFDPWERWIPTDPLKGPGAPISRAQFDRLVVAIRINGPPQVPPYEWGQEVCDNLKRNHLADVETP